MLEVNNILCGDALLTLKDLPPESVNCCITSPPYYGLRDYGVSGQIGLEQTPEQYIARLVDVFREVRRVLTRDGTLWVNIADSYAGSGKGAWKRDEAAKAHTKQRYILDCDNPAVQMPKVWPTVKAKDMIGIPWLLAFALRDDGWYLRSDIIWHKPNCMPHPIKDRPVNCYEHIFLLAKSKKYYFDYTALQVPVAESSLPRYRRGFKQQKYAQGAPGQSSQTIYQPHEGREPPAMRRGRDLWTISTNNYRSAHFATYPVELAKRCVLAGCPKGGVVLDPFFGAGTTGVAASTQNRQYIGIELNPDYCQIAAKRISEKR